MGIAIINGIIVIVLLLLGYLIGWKSGCEDVLKELKDTVIKKESENADC